MRYRTRNILREFFVTGKTSRLFETIITKTIENPGTSHIACRARGQQAPHQDTQVTDAGIIRIGFFSWVITIAEERSGPDRGLREKDP